MGQLIEFIVLALFIAGNVIALFITTRVLFTRLVENGQDVAARMPGRAFVLGLVNSLFLAVVVLVSYALGDNTGVGILYLPGLLTLGIFAIATILGLASVTFLIAERLFPERSHVQQGICGGAIVILACACPFVGWFLLLPYLTSLGIGAILVGLFQRRAKSVAETT